MQKATIIYEYDDGINLLISTLKERNISLRSALDSANSQNLALLKELEKAQNSITILKNQIRAEREAHKKQKPNKEALELFNRVQNGEALVIDITACNLDKFI